MNEYETEIDKYIKELSSDLQKQIRDSYWKSTLSEISKKYSLSDEQKTNLEREVIFIMIGIENEDDLVENLVNELLISKLLANELVDEIGNRIFKVISNKLNNESDLKTGIVPDNLPTNEPLNKIEVEEPKKEIIYPNLPPLKPKTENSQVINSGINNFFQNKLTSPTVNQKDESSGSLADRPVKQYSVDPYREPVE